MIKKNCKGHFKHQVIWHERQTETWLRLCFRNLTHFLFFCFCELAVALNYSCLVIFGHTAMILLTFIWSNTCKLTKDYAHTCDVLSSVLCFIVGVIYCYLYDNSLNKSTAAIGMGGYSQCSTQRQYLTL